MSNHCIIFIIILNTIYSCHNLNQPYLPSKRRDSIFTTNKNNPSPNSFLNSQKKKLKNENSLLKENSFSEKKNNFLLEFSLTKFDKDIFSNKTHHDLPYFESLLFEGYELKEISNIPTDTLICRLIFDLIKKELNPKYLEFISNSKYLKFIFIEEILKKKEPFDVISGNNLCQINALILLYIYQKPFEDLLEIDQLYLIVSYILNSIKTSKDYYIKEKKINTSLTNDTDKITPFINEGASTSKSKKNGLVDCLKSVHAYLIDQYLKKIDPRFNKINYKSDTGVKTVPFFESTFILFQFFLEEKKIDFISVDAFFFKEIIKKDQLFLHFIHKENIIFDLNKEKKNDRYGIHFSMNHVDREKSKYTDNTFINYLEGLIKKEDIFFKDFLIFFYNAAINHNKPLENIDTKKKESAFDINKKLEKIAHNNANNYGIIGIEIQKSKDPEMPLCYRLHDAFFEKYPNNINSIDHVKMAIERK